MKIRIVLAIIIFAIILGICAPFLLKDEWFNFDNILNNLKCIMIYLIFFNQNYVKINLYLL